MLEKNYTNEEDKGRFGFSESGTFRTAYKAEMALTVIFIIIFIAGTVGGLCGASFFLRYMIDTSPQATDPTFYAITSTVILVGAVILSYTIMKIGIAYTKRGYKCTYSATEEIFTANIGGDVHTIKYCDVSAVNFTPRAIFGKVTGYDIDVNVGNRIEHFALTFEGQYQSEKSTPFYIIKERIGIIENRRSDEAKMLADMKSRATSPLRPEDIEKARENKQTTLERTDALFAKASEMSAVTPVKPTALPLSEPEFDETEMPSVGKKASETAAERIKLSPTVESLVAEQARIDESERAKNFTSLEQANRARELDEMEIVGQGSFYIGRTGFPRILCIVAETILSLIELGALYFLMNVITAVFSSPVLFYIIGITVLYIALSTPICVFLRSGTEYRYSANAREFSFSRRDGKGAVAHFFYKDVLSVDYAPHKFLWYDNGYYVTIETKSGFFTYKYTFPRFKHPISQNDLPFEKIRERIDPRIKLPAQESVRLNLSKKEFGVQLVKIIVCVLVSAAVITLRVLSNQRIIRMYFDVSYAVIISLVAVIFIIFALRKIICGAEYCFRADSSEFVLHRADGAGKTIRASFDEIEQVSVKKRLLSAIFIIKCKTRTLRLRYIYPKITQKPRLEDTPFGVFLRQYRTITGCAFFILLLASFPSSCTNFV